MAGLAQPPRRSRNRSIERVTNGWSADAAAPGDGRRISIEKAYRLPATISASSFVVRDTHAYSASGLLDKHRRDITDGCSDSGGVDHQETELRRSARRRHQTTFSAGRHSLARLPSSAPRPLLREILPVTHPQATGLNYGRTRGRCGIHAQRSDPVALLAVASAVLPA